MIKAQHFEESLRRSLDVLGTFNPKLGAQNAVELLMGTAAQETNLGYYLRQHPAGPGRGPYSIEQATHVDVVRYLQRPQNAILLDLVNSMVRRGATLGDEGELVDNFAYAHAICRIRYWYETAPIAVAGDIRGHGEYWKQHFNTPAGAGTVEEFMANWKKCIK